MGHEVKARARRGRSDLGAAAVEFALLLPLFAMLAVGTISAGFAFEKWITVTQAARETSRYAATLPPETDMNNWFTAVKNVAFDSAGIDSSTPASSYYVCIRFVNAIGPGPSPGTQYKTYGSLGGTPSAPCTSSNAGDNKVEVLIRRQAEFNAVLFSDTITVAGKNSSRYEPRLTG